VWHEDAWKWNQPFFHEQSMPEKQAKTRTRHRLAPLEWLAPLALAPDDEDARVRDGAADCCLSSMASAASRGTVPRPDSSGFADLPPPRDVARARWGLPNRRGFHTSISCLAHPVVASYERPGKG
jgi:hypothetical protein